MTQHCKSQEHFMCRNHSNTRKYIEISDVTLTYWCRGFSEEFYKGQFALKFFTGNGQHFIIK